VVHDKDAGEVFFLAVAYGMNRILQCCVGGKMQCGNTYVQCLDEGKLTPRTSHGYQAMDPLQSTQ